MDGQKKRVSPRDKCWNAEDYARNASAQRQWAQELVDKLGLRGGESLLDIGCGDGQVTALLARRLPQGKVVGIDASRSMIKFASKQFPAEYYPNLCFSFMDAAALRLDPIFDIAFSNATLHWVKDHRAVLRGVRRCLRPGGRLLFQMGGKGNAAQLLPVVQAVIDEPAWREYFVDFQSPYFFYGIEEYRTWLTEHDFSVDRIELIPKDMRHNDEDGLKGWLRTTWFPYTNRVPPEKREALLSRIVAVYTDQYPTSDDRTCVKMMRLEVQAHAQ